MSVYNDLVDFTNINNLYKECSGKDKAQDLTSPTKADCSDLRYPFLLQSFNN